MNLQHDDIYEWIDRYLDGKMTPGEQAAFESRLRTDTDFLKTFEAQKALHTMVLDKELLALKEQMRRDLEGGKMQHKLRSNRWRYAISGAVAVAVLVLLYFLFRENQGLSPKHNPPGVPAGDSLFHKKEVPDTNAVLKDTTRGQSTSPAPAPAGRRPETMCRDTVISFSCQARAACTGRRDGAIEIDVNTIKYGKAPFTFSLHRDGDYSPVPVISDLKAGKYTLFVRDAGQCVRQLNAKVEVHEIQCEQQSK